jgi:hypothetical protein
MPNLAYYELPQAGAVKVDKHPFVWVEIQGINKLKRSSLFNPSN